MDLRTGSRFIRVTAVKFFDEAAGRDMREGFPRIIRIGISFPLDEILDPVSNTAGIEDVFDFEIFVIVFDVKRR